MVDDALAPRLVRTSAAIILTVSATCTISASRNDRIRKHIIVFPNINSSAPGGFLQIFWKYCFQMQFLSLIYSFLLNLHCAACVDPKSTSFQVMAWCRQATSHYLSQCWHSFMLPYGVTRPQSVNTLRLKQNGHHFPYNILKWIFLNENVWILINISLNLVPMGPINNIPVMVQMMAWRRLGGKPLSEPMMHSFMTHIFVTRSQWVNSARQGLMCDFVDSSRW